MLAENLMPAFCLTLLAGLSTGIGSSIAWFIRRPRMSWLSFALGLSAGVMVYVSFMELLPAAFEVLSQARVLLAFFGGAVLVGLIDLLTPNARNPHHGLDEDKQNLMRTGIFSAVVLAVHNFPEGLATFGTALGDLRSGIIVGLAIALHNIPEGIAVSMPIYYATGNRSKAFGWSFVSGLAEPLGALLGWLILMPFLSEALLAGMLAFVAGIMVYIALDELLPTAHRCGSGHTVISGVLVGMLVMAASLAVL